MARQEYDWVDRTLFLLFAYAHITDWELADSERSVIQSKTNYILKKINGSSPQHSSDEIELKMITAYRYWDEIQKESIDEVLTELQDIAGQIKFQNWFDFVKKDIAININKAVHKPKNPEKIISFRLFTRSANHPPTIPNKGYGAIPKNATNATKNGESVKSNTNHASKTICMFLVEYSIQFAHHRKP